MKKLTKFLIESIVSEPKKVKIDVKEENNLFILIVQVSPSDIGQVIGKRGRIVKALSSLIKVKAIKEGKRIALQIQENAA